jgi:hypothetical protein
MRKTFFQFISLAILSLLLMISCTTEPKVGVDIKIKNNISNAQGYEIVEVYMRPTTGVGWDGSFISGKIGYGDAKTINLSKEIDFTSRYDFKVVCQNGSIYNRFNSLLSRGITIAFNSSNMVTGDFNVFINNGLKFPVYNNSTTLTNINPVITELRFKDTTSATWSPNYIVKNINAGERQRFTFDIGSLTLGGGEDRFDIEIETSNGLTIEKTNLYLTNDMVINFTDEDYAGTFFHIENAMNKSGFNNSTTQSELDFAGPQALYVYGGTYTYNDFYNISKGKKTTIFLEDDKPTALITYGIRAVSRNFDIFQTGLTILKNSTITIDNDVITKNFIINNGLTYPLYNNSSSATSVSTTITNVDYKLTTSASYITDLPGVSNGQKMTYLIGRNYTNSDKLDIRVKDTNGDFYIKNQECSGEEILFTIANATGMFHIQNGTALRIGSVEIRTYNSGSYTTIPLRGYTAIDAGSTHTLFYDFNTANTYDIRIYTTTYTLIDIKTDRSLTNGTIISF